MRVFEELIKYKHKQISTNKTFVCQIEDRLDKISELKSFRNRNV